MIPSSVWFFLVACVFALTCAEPLVGEHLIPAEPRQFPFIASFGLKHPSNRLDLRRHFCTGSLITKDLVLTAEHCFKDKTKEQINVIVGDEDLSAASAIYEVDSWMTYDRWAQLHRKPIRILMNDIAVVKLSSPVNREGIIPVTLTHLNDQQLYRTKVVIVGWGITKENQLTNVLFKGTMTILKPGRCVNQVKLVMGIRIQLEKNFLCTSADPYMLISCGDSGGPLLDKDNFLLGINRSTCPNIHWGNFSEEFLNQYKVNRHASVNHYREFIGGMMGMERAPIACRSSKNRK